MEVVKMDEKQIKRKILASSKDFKKFWKDDGPFEYALSSKEFPPVLLEEEEWIFSSDITVLLKELMQFEKRKMKIVKSPFNPAKKGILRPEMLSSWKINKFPEEWNAYTCDIFIPEGHLTRLVFENNEIPEDKLDPYQVEELFFHCLENQMDQLGYHFFKPEGKTKYAAIKSYLSEWEKDDKDAGI